MTQPPASHRLREFEIAPDTENPTLSVPVSGRDHLGARVDIHVVTEKPLTVFLNAQEIVTLMTIGDYPDLLAAGYLLNQGMLRSGGDVTAIEHDPELETVVVRTASPTNFEEKLKKKVRTSGCAQGTVFGDLMEEIEGIELSKTARLKTSWLYALQKKINTQPSLYLKAGAIHGCVLCEKDRPLIYMEDVGRHNAADKIAGYMALNGVPAHDKIFYTTGRAHERDDHQDRENGHSDPRLALGLHSLGSGACAALGADSNRAHARQTLRRAVGRGASGLRPGCERRRR